MKEATIDNKNNDQCIVVEIRIKIITLEIRKPWSLLEVFDILSNTLSPFVLKIELKDPQ